MLRLPASEPRIGEVKHGNDAIQNTKFIYVANCNSLFMPVMLKYPERLFNT